VTTATSTTLTTARTVIVILTGDADWQEPLDRAARLAAATGKALRVLLADDDALVSAAALDCVRLVAWGGLVGAFDPTAARRLVRARRARLRGVLQGLAARHGIAAELAESAPATHWAGCAALTFFGRRRRGTLLVVHAGTVDTLDVAARLALEQHQEVRLLLVGAGSPAEAATELRRRFGHLLRQPPEALEEGHPLRRPSGTTRVTTVVLDPAYLTARNLTLEDLLDELRTVMGEVREATTPQAPSPA
jgi:hypothetical protein